MQKISTDEARALIAAKTGADAPLELPVDLLGVVDLAVHSRSEWRFAPLGMGGARAIGLNRTGINVIADWLGITVDRQMAEDLGVIEAEALSIFGEAA